jgi:hypothetical protein
MPQQKRRVTDTLRDAMPELFNIATGQRSAATSAGRDD